MRPKSLIIFLGGFKFEDPKLEKASVGGRNMSNFFNLQKNQFFSGGSSGSSHLVTGDVEHNYGKSRFVIGKSM